MSTTQCPCKGLINEMTGEEGRCKMEEERYTEPGALDLFKQKVEEHNAIIAKITERITEEKSEE